MKLLLDQGLPRSAIHALRSEGVDAIHAGDIGLATAEDAAILRTADSQGRVVVTLDADFHYIMVSSGATKPSVIRVRMEGLTGSQLAILLLNVIKASTDELEAGALVTVRGDRIRIRRLPLIP